MNTGDRFRFPELVADTVDDHRRKREANVRRQYRIRVRKLLEAGEAPA